VTSRKAVMKSVASSQPLVILVVFDGEGAKRPALQEVFENDVVVGGSLRRAQIK
jgi:hypothetical protein